MTETPTQVVRPRSALPSNEAEFPLSHGSLPWPMWKLACQALQKEKVKGSQQTFAINLSVMEDFHRCILSHY